MAHFRYQSLTRGPEQVAASGTPSGRAPALPMFCRARPRANRRIEMRIVKIATTVVLVAGTTLAAANEFATKEEAVAMVQKATAFIKEQGPGNAYPEISKRTGKFVDRDLYIVVYGMDGKVLAHGGNEKLVGKDLIDTQDVDGKFFVRDRVELASKQPEFWQDYKFVNPTTKKVEPKQMYCQRLEQTVVCGGIYKL